MAAIYTIFELNILGFQKNFSGLMAEPTNRPPVRDYDPDTPLLEPVNKKFDPSSLVSIPTPLGDHLMNDNNHLYLLEQTYPGCAEDELNAVACVEVMEEKQVEPRMLEGKTEEDTMFSKLLKANTTWSKCII